MRQFNIFFFELAFYWYFGEMGMVGVRYPHSTGYYPWPRCSDHVHLRSRGQREGHWIGRYQGTLSM